MLLISLPCKRRYGPLVPAGVHLEINYYFVAYELMKAGCPGLTHTLSDQLYECEMGRVKRAAGLGVWRAGNFPSNQERGFQRFGFENHFGAGGLSDLGQELGLLRGNSSAGVNLKPPFGAREG